MNKLTELDKKISELSDQLRELIKQRTELEFKGFYFEGKYIYLPNYGYINVNLQVYENNNTSISLSGERFDYSQKQDYFYYNKRDDITISTKTLSFLVKSGEFRELSKEEFNSELNEMVNTFINYSSKNI